MILSVCSIFKNESNSIVEWIEHYIYHGVNHFYLIDDDSDDNGVSLLTKYIDKITLFKSHGWNRYIGRQRDMYNHFMLPILKESDWVLVVDMDEYMWSPKNVDLKETLKLCQHMSQVQVNHTPFGSSGFIEQPPAIVPYFKYKSLNVTDKSYKYFVNTKHEFSSLNVHHATGPLEGFFLLTKPYFQLNHYKIQSMDHWKNVKCTRGDADQYTKRTIEMFHDFDHNEVIDEGLYEQNKLSEPAVS